MHAPRDALALFAKYPRLGRVKTRLEDLLSPRQCLLLHRALLADVAQRCRSLKVSHFLYLADCNDQEAGQLSRSLQGPWRVRLQQGADLGERMHRAYLELARSYRRVVFLGTDSPDLPLRLLRQAFGLLGRRAAVVGPSCDGGYYLLGLSQARPRLFEGIRWGSEEVLQQTLRRLDPEEVHLLEEWYDVDRGEDLRRLWRQLDPLQEGFPARTADFLRHCPQIATPSETEHRPAS